MAFNNTQEEGIRRLLKSNAKYIIGLDEVGRGCLAGPVVVAAAVFDKGWGHPDVKDSKKFSDSKKETAHDKRTRVLTSVITPSVLHTYIWEHMPEEIDVQGIENACVELFMLASRASCLLYPDSVVVVDGNWDMKVKGVGEIIGIPSGDDIVPAVSAASIVAKVHRDDLMIRVAEKHPGYGFEKHKGYGTPEHFEALERLGPCELHRQSFKPVREASPRL